MEFSNGGGLGGFLGQVGGWVDRGIEVYRSYEGGGNGGSQNNQQAQQQQVAVAKKEETSRTWLIAGGIGLAVLLIVLIVRR